MVEDNQIVPLAPSEINPRSDIEFAALKQKDPRQERSSKCLVYVLAGIVVLSAIGLVFAHVVLRPKSPDIEMSSVQVKDLSYGSGSGNGNNNASLPRFNMTLDSELKMENSNFGEFKFDNTSARVLYKGMSVGEVMLLEGRVNAKDIKMMNFKVHVRSHDLLNSTDLTSDINLGFLKMSCYAKFRGRVTLLHIANMRRSAAIDCNFTLNLRSRSVEDLVCN